MSGRRLGWMLVTLAVLSSACTSNKEKAGAQPQYAETPSKINAELGLGYMQQGENKRAMEKLQLSLQYNPKNAQAHHYLAELYRRLGEMEQADGEYQRALDLAADDSSLRNNYGAFLCEQRKFKPAELQFLLAVKDPLFAGKVQAYENIGLCAADAGEFEKAERYLRLALTSEPKLPKALYRMGVLNLEKGDPLRARAYLQRYEEVGSHTAETLWLGIQVEHQLGDREAMQRYARDLSRHFPDTQQYRDYIASRW